jgi:threonine dehydrogenase-like Zn-dependent dehydrogenase
LRLSTKAYAPNRRIAIASGGMARVLIVGCGCRGQALARALTAEGHAVRGTTRAAARQSDIEAAGAEAVVADPDRLATLMPALEGVSVVCWLMGTSTGDDLHGPRLESMLEHIVDTHVRGLVYETGGVERPAGVAAARRAQATYNMPVDVLTADPARHDAWLRAATAAVASVLAA